MNIEECCYLNILSKIEDAVVPNKLHGNKDIIYNLSIYRSKILKCKFVKIILKGGGRLVDDTE